MTDEPLTLTVDVVAGHLEYVGCPRMAAFVRRLASTPENVAREIHYLKRDVEALRSRLAQYEKPANPNDRSGGVKWTGD